MSDLDKDFEKIAEQINAKLSEAAAALKEANRLGKEAGLSGLISTEWAREKMHNTLSTQIETENESEEDDLYYLIEKKFELINVSSLELELENAGWSTSSSYC